MINLREVTYCAYLFLLSIIILSCEKEVITTREFPRVSIDEKIEQDANGITFSANIISEGNSEVTNKGFVWSRSEPVLRIYKSWVYLDKDTDFTTTVQWDLLESRGYTVRAFAQNGEFITYSNPIDFISEYNCPPPEIKDFYPKNAKWGENIVIEGSFFSYTKKYINVSLGNVDVTVDSCTNSKIFFTVPAEINEESTKISVELYDKTVNTLDEFKYIYPEFVDFYPKEAAIIDTLVIRGNNFHLESDYYKITIGGIDTRALKISDTEIKFIVPYKLKDAKSTIKITTMGITHVFEDMFSLQSP